MEHMHGRLLPSASVCACSLQPASAGSQRECAPHHVHTASASHPPPHLLHRLPILIASGDLLEDEGMLHLVVLPACRSSPHAYAPSWQHAMGLCEGTMRACHFSTPAVIARNGTQRPGKWCMKSRGEGLHCRRGDVHVCACLSIEDTICLPSASNSCAWLVNHVPAICLAGQPYACQVQATAAPGWSRGAARPAHSQAQQCSAMRPATDFMWLLRRTWARARACTHTHLSTPHAHKTPQHTPTPTLPCTPTPVWLVHALPPRRSTNTGGASFSTGLVNTGDILRVLNTCRQPQPAGSTASMSCAQKGLCCFGCRGLCWVPCRGPQP